MKKLDVLMPIKSVKPLAIKIGGNTKKQKLLYVGYGFLDGTLRCLASGAPFRIEGGIITGFKLDLGRKGGAKFFKLKEGQLKRFRIEEAV